MLNNVGKFIQSVVFIMALAFVFFLSYSEFFNEYGAKSYGIGFQIFSLSLIAVYVFAPFFDEIKIGKILELKRKVEIAEKKSERLEKRNDDLISQIIGITTHINQAQSNTNIYGITTEQLRDALKVHKASDEEIKESKKENDTDNIKTTSKNRHDEIRKIEHNIISSIAAEYSNFLLEARFTEFLDAFDPLMRGRPIIFDGYYQVGSEEVFLEVIRSNIMATDSLNRIYVMLNKIHLYSKAKGSPARLRLIIFTTPQEMNLTSIPRETANYFKRYFEPAIKSGYLSIEEINEHQIKQYIKQ